MVARLTPMVGHLISSSLTTLTLPGLAGASLQRGGQSVPAEVSKNNSSRGFRHNVAFGNTGRARARDYVPNRASSK